MKYFLTLPLLFLTFYANSQIRITNLMEAQLGKLPNENVDIFPSIYDRTEIDYRKKGWSANITIEQYHTTYDDRGYLDLSQLSLGYKKKNWEIKLGNFYETLGRGMLLRSFEIPGALLEDIGFRSRNYFHRDILGGLLKYKTKKATFQIMRGGVLNNTLPPTFGRSDRRTDIVSSLSADYKFIKGQKASVIFMRLESDQREAQHFISGALNGKIIKNLEYFGEYAFQVSDDDYALNAGLSGYSGPFSFTLEYKNYNNFILGAGINEPPAGVKQQTYRVLNRSIHVSNPLNEDGYQIDLFYNFENGSSINLNHSLAHNDFGAIETTFRQYFLEWTSSIGARTDYKFFMDYSQDPFKNESDRFSLGLYTDLGLSDKIRFLPEIEYQTFKRDEDRFLNFNLLLGLNINSKVFLSILGEVTTDPFLLKEGQSTRVYLGNTIRYKPNYNHTIQLFFGERRGGPQCSAGVCYEILDYKGVEVRWISKFKI